VIGVDGEARFGDVEAKKAAIGIGEHPLAQLLLDHRPLGFEVGLIDHQAAEPLGLGPDQPLQVIGRDDLVVFGEVVTGGGVVEPADVLGQPVETLWGQVARAFEHQVFEQMGEAGAAGGIIPGADPVPDLHGHIRGGAVDGGVEPQAVGQDPQVVGDRRDGGGRGRLSEGRGGRGGQQQGGQNADEPGHQSQSPKPEARAL
jgi:hypothetical protein